MEIPQVHYWVNQLIGVDRSDAVRTANLFRDAVCRAGREVIPELIRLLHHTHPHVRWGAARSLGAIGPDADAATPDLISVTRDSDAQLRHDSAMALGRISPTRPESIRTFIRILQDEDDDVCGAAQEGLSAGCPDCLQELLSQLSTADAALRREIVMTLSWLEERARPALPAMIKMLGDADADIRFSAASFVGKFGPEVALKPLERALASESDSENRRFIELVVRHVRGAVETGRKDA